MPLLQWDETMSVGAIELDDQHKMLMALINDAYSAVQRNNRLALPDLTARIQRCAAKHFETEETAMRRCGYPQAESHIGLHDIFRQQSKEFRTRKPDLADMPEAFFFLSRWFTMHIMNEDKQYASFMSEESTGHKA